MEKTMMPTGIKIRPMIVTDIAGCATIVCNSEIGQRYGFTLNGMNETLRAALIAGRELFVAVNAATELEATSPVNGTTCLGGFAWIDLQGAFSSAPYLRLIAVNESIRGAGIGSALLAEFERRGATIGRPYCLLVSDFNTKAIRFYERQGYSKRGELPDFAREGITEILMVKNLV